MLQDYLYDCHGAEPAPDFDIQVRISIFYSALAVYQSPSDISGISGLHREIIRATPSWRKNQPRYDCVFAYSESRNGRKQLDVARVMAFFTFIQDGKLFPCALVHEFRYSSRRPDKDTGFWIVEPKILDETQPCLTIISLDRILRAAHLIPVYKTRSFIPRSLTMEKTLDEFKRFYINRFIDYHAFSIVVREVSTSFFSDIPIILMPVVYLGAGLKLTGRFGDTGSLQNTWAPYEKKINLCFLSFFFHLLTLPSSYHSKTSISSYSSMVLIYFLGHIHTK